MKKYDITLKDSYGKTIATFKGNVIRKEQKMKDGRIFGTVKEVLYVDTYTITDGNKIIRRNNRSNRKKILKE